MNSSVKLLWGRRVWLFAAAIAACAAVVPRSGYASPAPAEFTPFSSSPLCFEANPAQSGCATQFIARGAQCTVLLEPDAAEILLGKSSDRAIPHQPEAARAVRLHLVGANPAAKISGRSQLAATANYFIGNDPAKWRSGVPLFSSVQVDAVYPGVQTVYYANQSAQLEYDFLLHPGAPPGQIRFRVEGADDVQVDPAGNLVLKIGGEEISQHQPVAYQVVSGERRQVAAGYHLNQDGTIGFDVSGYDHNLPLVIDPVLDFLTYLGGKVLTIGWAITLQGPDIYVAGETLSMKLPTNNPIVFPEDGTNRDFSSFQGSSAPNAFGDAFVASYSTNGTLNYFSYLGGNRDDGALAIAGDGYGGVWVTGFTDSTNFPTTPGALRTAPNGPNNNAKGTYPADAFITHVSPLQGTNLTLDYSTLFGGDELDEGTGIYVNTNSGDVYITGLTASTNLTGTAGVFQPTNSNLNFNFNLNANVNEDFDAFVAEVSPSNAPPEATVYTNTFTTYLGGTNTTFGLSIALDSAANTWITGVTFATNFPTANIAALSNSFNSFLATLGTNAVETNHLFADLNSQTNSHNHNTSFHSDAFVSEFSPGARSLLFSTLLGGSNDDAGIHLAIDFSNNVYVTGYTLSRDFPTNVATVLSFSDIASNPPVIFPNATTNFQSHAFVTELVPTNYVATNYVIVTNEMLEGTNEIETTNVVSEEYLANSYIIGASTSLGGDGADRATGIALDSNGNVFIIGSAGSTNFFNTNVVILTNSLANVTQVNTNKHGVITNYVLFNPLGVLTNNYTFTNMSSTNFVGRLKRSGMNTNDIFIAELSPGLTNYLQSIILGGPGANEPNGIAVDPSGSAVYFVGDTTSKTNFATTNAAQFLYSKGGTRADAFIGRISGFPQAVPTP